MVTRVRHVLTCDVNLEPDQQLCGNEIWIPLHVPGGNLASTRAYAAEHGWTTWPHPYEPRILYDRCPRRHDQRTPAPDVPLTQMELG